MNNLIISMLSHKSIRKYKNKEVEPELMEQLYKVLSTTPSSSNMQQYSVIRIRDKKIKSEISTICGQKFVCDLPELFIFIADNYRNYRICKDNEHPVRSVEIYKFFQGYADAMIASNSLALAAESLGLGYVYLGSVLNNLEKLIDILALPKYTFPIIGLGLGYPDYYPQLKPKMNYDFKVFEDNYNVFDDYKSLISDYDEIISNYYKKREMNYRDDNFTNQVIKKIIPATEERKLVIKFLLKQGYKLDI